MTIIKNINTVKQLQMLKGHTLLIGEEGVGKTTVIREYLSNSLNEGEFVKYIDHQQQNVDLKKLREFIEKNGSEPITIVIDHYFDDTKDYQVLWKPLEEVIASAGMNTRFLIIQRDKPSLEQLEVVQNIIEIP